MVVRWDAGCPTKKRFDEPVAALDEHLDKMGLKAGIVHGKKSIDINSIPSYNPNAAEVYTDVLNSLNDVPFPLLEQLEVCAGVQFSYIEALLFIIAPNVPYAGDAGVTAIKITPVEEVVTVQSDFDVLAKTVSDIAAPVTLASAPDVSASGPSTLVIPEDSLF
ncbi:hypothetical protein Tco_0014255 [Tanacetum coccineum]